MTNATFIAFGVASASFIVLAIICCLGCRQDHDIDRDLIDTPRTSPTCSHVTVTTTGLAPTIDPAPFVTISK